MKFLRKYYPERIRKYLEKRDAKLEAMKARKLSFLENIVAWVKTVVWAVSVVTIINGLAIASFVVPTGSMQNTVMAGDFLMVNKFWYGPSTPQVIPFVEWSLPFYKLPPLWAPKQGDVICFIFPGNRDEVKAAAFQYYLKRCVAISGDTLEIRDRTVIVNGLEFPLPEHGQFSWGTGVERSTMVYASSVGQTFPPGRGYTMDNWGPMRIPKKGDTIYLDRANIREWLTFIRREGHTVNPADIVIDGSPASFYIVERDYVFGMGDNRDNSLDSRYWGFVPKSDVVGIPMFVFWSWDNIDHESMAEYRRRHGYDPPMQIERSLFGKLANVRWSRIGTIIR